MATDRPTPANHDEAVQTYVQVTAYKVSAVPEGLGVESYIWDIDVEYRGDGLWAVKRFSQVLGSNGKWDYEPLPSSRTDRWKRTHRFTEQEALRLAAEAAPHVTVNGHTVPEYLAKNGG